MKENLNDLRTFLLVAQSGSFTKAAAQLGVSQSALSHAVRALEERLKIKLLHRTTRSMSTTEAGERLLDAASRALHAAGKRLYQRLLPLFDHIDQEICDVRSAEGGLTGHLRINGIEHALTHVLWEKFQSFMRLYPHVSLELVADNRFIDIVAERFDAGVRLGDDVAKDMIAVRISADLRMCVAAAPDYLARHGTPQTPRDLTEHACLSMRLQTHGGLLHWEFADPKRKGKTVTVQVDQTNGAFIANNATLLQKAACAGMGLIWTPRDAIKAELDAGNLQTVLDDWAIAYPGYHLYYPNRRADSPLFRALVEALRE